MTPVSFGPVAQERIGNLDQDAGAVADQRIGAHRAAMVEIDQELQALADDLVGLCALDVGDKADAAGVMLVARVVETLFRRQTHFNPNQRPQAGAVSPPSHGKPEETPVSQNYPACEHAASCGATCQIRAHQMSAHWESKGLTLWGVRA